MKTSKHATFGWSGRLAGVVLAAACLSLQWGCGPDRSVEMPENPAPQPANDPGAVEPPPAVEGLDKQ